MTTRDHAPVGAPCWADLWTSDVEGSRRFYAELFGWEANEPSEEFGGYFMFTKDGRPVAGGMGDMGDAKADNTWKVYFATDDIAKTAELSSEAGAQLQFPPMAVADLGSQTILVDPQGAVAGLWQPDSFHGFSTIGEPGTPSWFELHTRDFNGSIGFYTGPFRLEAVAASDTDEFRYFMLKDASGSDVAGVMDAAGFLPEGTPAQWSIYWEVTDARASVEKVRELGGSVVMDCQETPYGHLAAVADPAGAQFKLRQTS